MKLWFGIKALDVPGGGAERVLATVASGLAARGHDVRVVTFDAPGGQSFYPLHARVQRVALHIGPADRPTDRATFIARTRALRRSVRDLAPDVTVGFMHSMFVPLAFATTGLHVPLVASEHIVRAYYRGRAIELALLMAACRRAARVTVLSEAVRAGYPAAVRAKMVVMPNPVSAPGAASNHDRTTERIVLNVGRLEAQKDQATLIDAFGIIAPRYPGWALRIVGEGTLRGALEQRLAATGLGSRARVLPATNRIEDEYARAHVFAMSSRFESFGIATAEAMAAGLPVVGFADCPGTNELVRNGENGVLVDVVDGDRARALAEGLARLMESDALRRTLGEGARRSVEAFDPERVVTLWERLLEDVVANAPMRGDR